ncbi:Molybdopterin converting factor, small subunit [Nakamurella panacisegetis]|uniref:Molybdopterin converting factor, small subunit n=1 Tax=Nakamurella panacisegetis TaxID=1090615 RepID=A0A1H0PMW2_9ACTN|nr:MoaD/ThiS family protein [Nakamurella panacisegetis]SDP05938.1 Molybdopterin converting factor, small subunit [Nakamurella panacisegetis]
MTEPEVEVRVLVPGMLRPECGGESVLTVRCGSRLKALLDEMESTWPRLHRRIRDEQGEIRRYVNVYVDGEDCRTGGGQNMPLRAGSEVQVLPSVAGGCR